MELSPAPPVRVRRSLLDVRELPILLFTALLLLTPVAGAGATAGDVVASDGIPQLVRLQLPTPAAPSEAAQQQLAPIAARHVSDIEVTGILVSAERTATAPPPTPWTTEPAEAQPIPDSPATHLPAKDGHSLDSVPAVQANADDEIPAASTPPAQASSPSSQTSPIDDPLPAASVGAAEAPPAVATPQTTAATATPTGTPASPAASVVTLEPRERGLLDAMNRERSQIGLPLLRLSDGLTTVARARAQDMVDHDYFAHFAPDGQSAFTLVAARGLRFAAIGENLARADGDAVSSVDVAMRNFMASPTHRANILDARYTEVGVGVALTDSGVAVLAVVFGG